MYQQLFCIKWYLKTSIFTTRNDVIKIYYILLIVVLATKVFWLTTSGLNNEEGNWKNIYLKLDKKMR